MGDRTVEERLTILEDRFQREVESGGRRLAAIDAQLGALGATFAHLGWKLLFVALGAASPSVVAIIWVVRVGFLTDATAVSLAAVADTLAVHTKDAENMTRDYLSTRAALVARVAALEDATP